MDSENVVRAGDVSPERPVPQAKGISCKEGNAMTIVSVWLPNDPTSTVVLPRNALVGGAFASSLVRPVGPVGACGRMYFPYTP